MPPTITRAPNGNLTRPCGSIPPNRKPCGKAGILIQRKDRRRPSGSLSLVSGTDAASPEVLYNKALAMYQMGLTDDAGTDLGTYAREHPNDAEAQNALAW